MADEDKRERRTKSLKLYEQYLTIYHYQVIVLSGTVPENSRLESSYQVNAIYTYFLRCCC